MADPMMRSWLGRFGGGPAGYLLAVVAVALTTALRYALDPILGDTAQYTTFHLAVMLAAVAGGPGPGLLATALGALLGMWLFVEPRNRLALGDADDILRLAIFLAIGIGVSIIAGWLHTYRRQAEQGMALARREIAEHERAEEALRESELRYRTLFDSIDEGFCIIEVIFDQTSKPIDYRFLEVNPSFEKQTGLANAQGKRMRELAPKHEEHWFETYGRIALTGQPARFQNRAEQLHRWYDVYAFRIGQPEDRQVAILFSDITQHKRAEEALQAANRELTDFATIVSHDLKSPLRAVATLARWMQSDYGEKLDEEGRGNLAEMVKRVGRMDQMIEDILAYSRLGREQEKQEPVALAELVPTVVQDLAPPAHVQVHIADSLPLVYGEPVRLRQLFQNLIGNAIKYGDKPQTEIRILCADAGDRWQFGVADNGPGIEERHFERIFRMFQTLAPKDKTDSTGVGLALVKRIVERAGGRIWVESRLGQGSTFHFTWPKAAARRDQPAAKLATEDSHA